ncbi:MAG: radical SAM protein, partial [Sphingobacteriales bacterium]|nr:radical SAM protein [Sphingobacteriales bacterium]
MQQTVTDKYGRLFKTLRVSLLNRCNLSCVYCTMGADDVKENVHATPALSSQGLLAIIQQLHSVLQLQTIRLTGGEPLLYHYLNDIIKGIKDMGIPEIKLTTNGFLLERMAKPMKDAGMSSINVSLDAVDEDVFFLMAKRNHLQKVLNGIDAALNAGLEVKINAVIMKGINESQVLPLLEY